MGSSFITRNTILDDPKLVGVSDEVYEGDQDCLMMVVVG